MVIAVILHKNGSGCILLGASEEANYVGKGELLRLCGPVRLNSFVERLLAVGQSANPASFK
jgi:hypothetical protein